MLRYKTVILFLGLLLLGFHSSGQKWQQLHNMVVEFYAKGELDSAVAYSKKAFIQAETEFGSKDTIFAAATVWLAYLYNEKQEFKKAKYLYLKALAVYKEHYGENHSDYATCLNNLAAIYKHTGELDKAMRMYKKTLNIKKEIAGEIDYDYALTLNNLASLYFEKNYLYGAEKYLIKSLRIYKEVIGVDTKDYVITLSNLALLYLERGNYSKAEPSFLQAIKIWEFLSIKHPLYAITLNNLGVLYRETGSYEKAEKYLSRATVLQKEELASRPSDYASSMNNLGVLYLAMGNFEKAEEVLGESLRIQKEKAGGDLSSYASVLNGLAGTYKQNKNYEKAKHYYSAAAKIYKQSLGENHVDYARVLSNLAGVYSVMGDYEKAMPLFEKTVLIFQKGLGDSHPSLAIAMSNQAYIYTIWEDYTKAESLYLKSSSIINKVYGSSHPYYAISLSNLASLYSLMKDNIKAEKYFIESNDLRLMQINEYFSFLSESEKEKFLATIRKSFDEYNGFALLNYGKNNEISKNVYNNQLSIKGILFNAGLKIRTDIYHSNDQELISQYKNWISLKEQIGVFSSYSLKKREEREVNIDSLLSMANTLEKELSSKSNAFAEDIRNKKISWKDVQASLNESEAAVEFVRYRIKDKMRKDGIQYAYFAMIIKSDTKRPLMIPLCSEKRIETLLKHFRIYQVNLHDELWQPLEKHLEGIEDVYISPDGVLNKVSFAMLKNRDDISLVEKHKIHYLNSTRKLAERDERKPSTNKTIVLMGGVDYNTDLLKKSLFKRKNKGIPNRVHSLKKQNKTPWSYLDGSLAEVQGVKAKFDDNKWETELYIGKEALEEKLQLLSGEESPAVIHLSTHGFFLSDETNLLKAEEEYSKYSSIIKNNSNPLYKSGLLLAGANSAWMGESLVEDGNDGILTAYEVSNTCFGNTDLVVLSACETGRGEIKTGEGVYGLQRSFQLAGAKSVMMSLWQVPDKETMELIQLFYSNWIEKGDIHNALREAQLELRSKYHPYFWAGFVIIE